MASQEWNTAAPIEKWVIPLENNQAVFTHLAQKLGLESSEITFHDVFSLDDDAGLLALVPRPAHALIFTCPQDTYHRARDDEDAKMAGYANETDHDEESIMWFKQTIHNSCGMMALLHALCNGKLKAFIRQNSLLDQVRREALPLSVSGRARLLEHSQPLEDAHMEAGRLGDTEAPSRSARVQNHYICFVKGDDGHLWELNGGMKGPVDRGSLADDEDALSDRALRLGVQTFVDKAEGDMRFTLVAVTQSGRVEW